MAFDHTPQHASDDQQDFLKQLGSSFSEGSLTNALREDLETLSAMSDEDLQAKGLTRMRVERAVRRKHIQSLYG